MTFPPEVLWTWHECKSIPTVGMTASNMSHPPMQCVICHENGEMVTDVEWKAIWQSAILVAHTHFYPLILTSQTKQTQKKMHFKWYFETEWAVALQELKSLAPLLSLCAREYKANHTLGGVLHNDTSPPAAPPVSHASTPSSLGPSRPPTCIGPLWHTPHHNSLTSSVPDPPPSTAPSSTISHCPPSPCHITLRSSQKDIGLLLTTAKGTHQHEPSPEPVEKRAKTERTGMPMPMPCFVMLTPPSRC